MPGAYAHITLVNLAKETPRLEAVESFPIPAIIALQKYFKYCELGAVSPDYPYLAITHSKSKDWADRLHHERIGDTIKVGIELVTALKNSEREKAFAWLAGFVAHVVADVTIHPVVELKVGPYEGNERAHRVCEMHQDAYIFQRLNLGDIGLSEHLRSGIWGCCVPPDSGKLDPLIEGVWQRMLKTSYPEPYSEEKPQIDRWHKEFRIWVDRIGEEGNRLLPIARHIAVNCGLTYPAPIAIDPQYTMNLATPEGNLHYGVIFDKALANVVHMWRSLAGGIFSAEATYRSAFGNWDLDSGRDEKHKLVFWSPQ